MKRDEQTSYRFINDATLDELCTKLEDKFHTYAHILAGLVTTLIAVGVVLVGYNVFIAMLQDYQLFKTIGSASLVFIVILLSFVAVFYIKYRQAKLKFNAVRLEYERRTSRQKI